MLEVGEYVRTKNGNIGKIKNIEYVNIDIDWVECDSYGCSCIPEYIKKHSKNIIDLIEVGDYVNGIKVAMIDIDNFDEEGTDKKYLLCGGTAIFNDEIETILTKEQMEANQYVVK